MRGVARALFFFFNDTATTEIYTLSLHDALPIYIQIRARIRVQTLTGHQFRGLQQRAFVVGLELEERSEEHTSELQSQSNLVCRLLLEKKKLMLHGKTMSAIVRPGAQVALSEGSL